MSVFEDLIDELKNENLLEDTVLGQRGSNAGAAVDPLPSQTAARMNGETNETAGPESPSGPSSETGNPVGTQTDDSEFFRKLAMNEVASLQMVEHVLSAVEREHLKVVPMIFDDLAVKKALHQFLQVAGELGTKEHTESEFELRNETETWNLALYERDKNISVANLRRYCEDSRPVLSSQALIALARFYRNSSYSEDARGKFDYVMTRLFTRDSGEGRRQFLFEEAEMLKHINRLYAEWSSIALFSTDEDGAEVELTVTRLGEFAAEVAEAHFFSELLKSDFFSRVRAYKEECAELFYVPEVVAAAIRCNLAIGNLYVELISRERSELGASFVEEKYGPDHDDIVSDVAGKTLTLAQVLTFDPFAHDDQDGQADAEEASGPVVNNEPTTRIVMKAESRPDEPRFDIFAVNKWLLAVCVACILLSAGVYIWAEKFAPGNENTATSAAPVKIDDQDLKKYVRNARSTKETLYAVVEPSFASLSEQEKKDYLSKLRSFAESKSLKKVTLLGPDGQSVAFASRDRLDISME